MEDFVIDSSNGIGYFRSLKEDLHTPNLVTYDNTVWGNMNPTFALDDNEEALIKKKDHSMMDILGVNAFLAMVTPLDNTMVEVNNKVLDVLFFERDIDSVRIHGNAVVISEKLNRDIAVAIAARDCAVVVLKSNKSEVFAVIHIGAPQIFEGLHEQSLRYMSALLMRNDLSDYTAYIYPHITQSNYKLRDEKLELLGDRFNDYLDSNNGFDFIGVFKDYMKESYGIGNIVDSGIDSYDAAKSGNMYSYTLEKEQRDSSQKPIVGAHNVVVKI